VAKNTVRIQYVSETKDLERGTKKAESLLGDLNKRGKGIFSGLSKSAGAFGLALGAGGLVFGVKKAIDAASNLNESADKARRIFGEASAEVEKFGEGAATQFGLSKRAALDAASGFGILLGKTGEAPAQIAAMSTQLAGLSGDLASFANLSGGAEEASQKLTSVLAGETEAGRSLGIVFNAATVEAKALALGLADTAKELTEGDKILARYKIVLEETATQQGNFADTSDGLANQQRTLAEQWENAQATLGQKLLPLATQLVGVLTDMIPVIVGVVDGVDRVVNVFGGWKVASGFIIGGLLLSKVAALAAVLTTTLVPALAAGTAGFTAMGLAADKAAASAARSTAASTTKAATVGIGAGIAAGTATAFRTVARKAIPIAIVGFITKQSFDLGRKAGEALAEGFSGPSATKKFEESARKAGFDSLQAWADAQDEGLRIWARLNRERLEDIGIDSVQELAETYEREINTRIVRQWETINKTKELKAKSVRAFGGIGRDSVVALSEPYKGFGTAAIRFLAPAYEEIQSFVDERNAQIAESIAVSAAAAFDSATFVGGPASFTRSSSFGDSTLKGGTGIPKYDVIIAAKQWLGVNYAWGGGRAGTPGPSPGSAGPATKEGEVGLDCSGLIYSAYRSIGITLAASTSQGMATIGREVSPANESTLMPGDIIINNGGKHAVLYVGQGNVIAASSSTDSVVIQPLSTHLAFGFVTARRVLESGEQAPAGSVDDVVASASGGGASSAAPVSRGRGRASPKATPEPPPEPTFPGIERISSRIERRFGRLTGPDTGEVLRFDKKSGEFQVVAIKPNIKGLQKLAVELRRKVLPRIRRKIAATKKAIGLLVGKSKKGKKKHRLAPKVQRELARLRAKLRELLEEFQEVKALFQEVRASIKDLVAAADDEDVTDTGGGDTDLGGIDDALDLDLAQAEGTEDTADDIAALSAIEGALEADLATALGQGDLSTAARIQRELNTIRSRIASLQASGTDPGGIPTPDRDDPDTLALLQQAQLRASVATRTAQLNAALVRAIGVGNSGTTVIFQSVVPTTEDQAAAAAGIFTQGLSQPGFVSASTEKVGL